MNITLLQSPSPPFMNVKRDYAGGMGVADGSIRDTYGHDEGAIILPYMSLLYSAAILEREHYQVTFIDAQTERLTFAGVCEQLRQHTPDMLIAVINLPSLYADCELLKKIKTAFPQILVVAIGTVTIPLFDEIARSGACDSIVRGDAEAVVADLARYYAAGGSGEGAGFHREHGVVTNSSLGRVRDLDAYPALPYHLVPIDEYWYHVFGKQVKYAPVFASRGCSFKCYYCPYPMGFGEEIVYRDPVKVVDEIQHLQEHFGVEGILFRDQVFTMDHERVRAICDEIITRGLKLEWVVETRLDRVSEPILRKMKQAGCKRIHYGLESGDPRLFGEVGKDRAEGRMQVVLENFALTERVGIGAHMFILIGLLGETTDSIKATIETIKKMKPLTLQVAIVTPYPGTALFDEAKKEGLLLTENWSQYTGFKPVARTKSLTARDLMKARKQIIGEHRRAVFLKRKHYKIKLLIRYVRDGSLPRRLTRKGKVYARFIRRYFLPKRLKGYGAQLLLLVGGMQAYRRLVNKTRKKPFRVLSLHRVINDKVMLSVSDRIDLARGCLSLDEFSERIRYLKKHYTFMSLPRWVKTLAGYDRVPRNRVLLTFDDGYKDIITYVYPLLKQERIPFTVFLTTDLIGKDSRMLNWNDVASLAEDRLVSFGSHGVSHARLTQLPLEVAESEIATSKRILEEKTHRPIGIFSYPDGRYDEAIIALLKQYGYKIAFTTGRDVNEQPVDPFAIKRIPFSREPFARFVFRAAGLK